MPRYARFAPAVLALLSITALDACRRKPKTDATTPPSNTVDSSAILAAQRDSIARAQRDRFVRDSIANANRGGADAVARARAALTATVYFDYNSSDLRADSRASLDSRIPVLRANPAIRLVIAGHTDERGSTEYNLALGQRRAAEVRRYLTANGIAEARIEIVSFGEERPAVSGGGESAWSQNRRAEFEIASGGESIQVPRP